MNKTYTVGLGEPVPVGKRALFQPSKEEKKVSPAKIEQGTRRRLRTTIELSVRALAIIQEMQTRHRLETGKVLPLWKLVCQAIGLYGKSTNSSPKTNLQ